MKKLFKINIGTLAAKGLYNIQPKDESDPRISYWFDKETYMRLKQMSVADFNKWCQSQVS